MRTRARYLIRLAREAGPAAALTLWRRERQGDATPVPATLFGQTVALRPGTPDTKVALGNLGGEFDALKSLPAPRPGALIVDCGAYIGTATLALRRMFPEATIVAVEPSPENFAQLAANTAGLDRVHVRNAALTTAEAGDSVTLSSRSTGEWGFTIVPQDGPRAARSVPTITLDRIMAEMGADEIFVLKMDIEGAELPLLREPDGWLPRTRALAIELHERIAPGVEATFRAANAGREVRPLGSEKYLSLRT